MSRAHLLHLLESILWNVLHHPIRQRVAVGRVPFEHVHLVTYRQRDEPAPRLPRSRAHPVSIRWFRERLHLRDSRHIRPFVRRLRHDDVSQSSRAVDRPREPSPRRFHARALAIRRRVFGKHTEDVICAGAHELHLDLDESHARDGFRQRQRGVVRVASYGERVRSRRVRARRANHQRACDRQRARAREATTSHRSRRGMQVERQPDYRRRRRITVGDASSKSRCVR